MSDFVPSWLVENPIALVAVIVSVASLTATILIARGSAVKARRPVLVFEYSPAGCMIENVGNGPALDVLLAFRGDVTPWKYPIRVPSLARDRSYLIKELGALNVRYLGAAYTDSAGRWYTTESVDDRNHVRAGKHLPDVPDNEIIRHWRGVKLEDRQDVV